MEEEKKKNLLWGFVYWAPRVLAILFILFLGLFSLDVFGQGYGFWGTALAFFMHNIPALILLVILIISWKREIIAGVAFILAAFLYMVSVFWGGFEWFKLSWMFTISGPAILVGVLFIINWFKRKNN